MIELEKVPPYRFGVTFGKFLLLVAAFLLAALLFLYVCTDVLQTLFTTGVSDYRAAPSLSSLQPFAPATVILDAGHGGADSGARTADGAQEKDLNLAITNKIAQVLSIYGYNPVLTRRGEAMPEGVEADTKKHSELLSRAKIASDTLYALFVSIHMNSFPQAQYAGAQVFYTERNLQNEVFAVKLQSALVSLIQPENTRLAKATSSVFLLERLDGPAVLLECGFLSNPAEAALLQDEGYQNRFAFAVASAIAQYLSDTQ